MKKVYDAVCVTGEYKNKQGETKKNYLTVGTVFEGDNGGLSLKLNAIPVGFSGWINFYVPKESAKDSKPEPKQQDRSNFDDMDSDIPF